MSTFTNNNVSSGDVVRASDHNTQGANIAAVVNGDIDNANISATAAISTTKLASDGFLGAWQTWTPSYTNITVNNGTVTANYVVIGKTVHFRYVLTCGSTTSITSGIEISLPVEAHADYNVEFGFIIGQMSLRDSGVAQYFGYAQMKATSATILNPRWNDGTVNPSNTFPITEAVGDVLMLVGTYEAA